MDQKSLKTATWQRVVILVIAVLLLGSMVVTYMAIVMGGSSSGSSSNNTEELIAELTQKYDDKKAELTKAAEPLSEKYFGTLRAFQSNVKAYNAASATAAGLESTDLKEGTGKTLTEGDKDYMAYYIGWCADGSIFDSSFNDYENPTALKAPIDPSVGLIEGWNQGVIGMKIGGVRQITMNGDLAYGDTQEVCGGYNSPLKFIVMPIDYDKTIADLSSELDNIYLQMYYAYYGSSL